MISNNKAPAKASAQVVKPIPSQPVKTVSAVKASPIQKNTPQAQATPIQKPAPPKPQNQVQAQPMKKEAKKPQKEESKNQKTPIKKESKAPPKNDSKAPAQNNQQKEMQIEQLPVFEFKRTIKLPALLESILSDKSQDKSSFFFDETGTAFSFFKYKGELIDVASYLVRESLGQVKREDCIENARKTFVTALQMGGTLVFYVDLIYTNLGNFFKEAKFFSDQESIFTYSKLLEEEFYKKQILNPDEDIDYLGNKGAFKARSEDFEICVLCNVTKGSSYNPQEIIQNLGLDQLKNCFNTTLIIEKVA